MDKNSSKNLTIGFAGSHFLLYYSGINGLEEMVSYMAHYAGLFGGLILTSLGIFNYIKDSKLKTIQLQKEAIELEIRKKQLGQLENDK